METVRTMETIRAMERHTYRMQYIATRREKYNTSYPGKEPAARTIEAWVRLAWKMWPDSAETTPTATAGEGGRGGGG